jgi:phosphoribosylanthranilate isomerase
MIMKEVRTKGNSNQVGIIVDEVSGRAIHIQLGNEVITRSSATTATVTVATATAFTTVALMVEQQGIDSCSDVECYLSQQNREVLVHL